jgi:hypothetical protein
MQTLEPSPKIAAGNAPQLQSVATTRMRNRVDDPRWHLAQRIAASSSLGRSRLLADFLLYVVDRQIRNRGDEITEQQIGVLVFGRSEGYDSNEDNIVRSYARNLRKRIHEYFATEGIGEDLLLEIPRGGYTPIFSARTPAVDPATAEEIQDAHSETQPNEIESPAVTLSPTSEAFHEEAASSPEEPGLIAALPPFAKGRTGFRNHLAVVALCIGIALGLAAAAFVPRKLFKSAVASSAEVASANLWTQIFSSDRDTFIVPSDDGLVIMQGLTERPVSLDSYVSGSYRTNVKAEDVPGAPEILKLGGRRYTSVVDLDFVAHLAQLDEVVPGRMMIRYARDLRMDDLRAGNAVLIGSVEANPWIELFQSQLNFRFSINPGNEKPSGIVNSHPRPGEDKIFGTPGPDHTYGLIAFVPNLDSTGHVLIVGGLNTAGTQAASRFLLTPSLMMPTLQRAKTAQGSLQPFELLVGAGNVAANASTPQLILERIGQPQH